MIENRKRRMCSENLSEEDSRKKLSAFLDLYADAAKTSKKLEDMRREAKSEYSFTPELVA